MSPVSQIEGYRKKWGEPEAPALTPREREILMLVAEGRGNQEIGERLGISLRTVKVHLANIFVKLGVNRRTEAVALAYSDSRCLAGMAG